jgi:hypothetical protein
MDAVSCRADELRGCRWGATTRHMVLDIDTQSKYHNLHALEQLKQSLWRAGITRTRLYQSSSSAGWHLYIFWTDFVPTEALHKLVKDWLLVDGFEIRSGTLELFPSGNGLRFPLQPGFAWLDDTAQIQYLRDDLTPDYALDLFLTELNTLGNDWTSVSERLEELLRQALQSRTNQALDLTIQLDHFDEMVQDATANLEVDRWERGKTFWQNGLQKAKQRHEAILAVGYYLWFGDTSAGLMPLPGRLRATERGRLIRDWLERKHNGFCAHINKGDWEKVEADIERAIHWRRSQAQTEHTPYLITDRLIERQMQTLLTIDQMREANQKRELGARRKISRAVDDLLDAGKKVSIHALARITGCSRNTIRRHKDLWLSDGSGDLSPLGCLSSSDSVVLSFTGSEKEKKEFLAPPSAAEDFAVVAFSLLPSGSLSEVSEDVPTVLLATGLVSVSTCTPCSAVPPVFPAATRQIPVQGESQVLLGSRTATDRLSACTITGGSGRSPPA